MTYLWMLVIGLIGGISSGLFGIGGGAVFVPLLILLCRFDAHFAIGTSLVVIVPTAIAAAVKHGIAGMIDWRAAVIVAVFAIIGAWLGAKWSLQLDVVLLRRLFAVFLLILSVKIFFTN